jgi:hypothetical protein
MQTAVRPHFTAGIAALGASAIIATTAAVAPPQAHISPMSALPDITSSVELAALVNPVSAIGEIIQNARTQFQQLLQNQEADPFPIAHVLVPQTVGAIGRLLGIGQATITGLISGVQQWVPYSINSFIKYAKAGDWADALSYIVTPLAGIGIGLYQPISDLANLAAGPFNTVANLIKAVPSIIVQGLAAGVLSPISQVATSVGYAIDQFSGALKSGNLGNLYNAAVNSAVNFTNTVVTALIGPYGIIGTLLNLRSTIAQALNPTTPAAAATAATALPSTTAKSVTLSTTTTAADTPTKVTKATPDVTTDKTKVSDAKVAETATTVAAKDAGATVTTDTSKTDTATTIDSTKATKDHGKKDAAAGQAASNTKGSKGTHGKGGVGKRSHASHRGHSHHNN